MAVRIITYDLNNEQNNQSRTKILEFIKQYSYARLSESTYAIETNETPKQLYQKVQQYIDKSDIIVILTMASPWYGQHTSDVNDWLSKKIPLG